jgi:hypothetical protein
MAITMADLITELGGRTEGEFTNAQCVTALNSAQDMVVGLADKELLNELVSIDTIALLAGATCTLSSIDSVNNLILSITQSEEPYMEYELVNKLKANKLRRNSFLRPTRNNPKGYIIGRNFYSLCDTDDESEKNINVEYISQPTKITDGETTWALNPTLKEPILLAGESYLWRTDDELERSNDAYQKFIAFMQIINDKDIKMQTDEATIAQAKKVKER